MRQRLIECLPSHWLVIWAMGMVMQSMFHVSLGIPCYPSYRELQTVRCICGICPLGHVSRRWMLILKLSRVLYLVWMMTFIHVAMMGCCDDGRFPNCWRRPVWTTALPFLVIVVIRLTNPRRRLTRGEFKDPFNHWIIIGGNDNLWQRQIRRYSYGPPNEVLQFKRTAVSGDHKILSTLFDSILPSHI